MKAIETRYAGCHFRSRLEARWAVAFDALGIRWEYERQGYMCGRRLSLGWDDDEIPYLPDFWFPDFELHGEVKGSLNNEELLRLLDCAADLSCNGGGGCHDQGGNDVVVFGHIPAPTEYRLPTRLHMHKGDLLASPWLGESIEPWQQCGGTPVARDIGGGVDLIVRECDLTPERVASLLLHGSSTHQPSQIGRAHV